MKNVVIACGGTGGHLTPGIALAQSLDEKGCATWLLISQKEVDLRLCAKYPKLTFVPIPGAPLQRSFLGWLRFVKGLVHSIVRSRSIFRRIDADLVVGFGGFSTLGPAIAAGISRVPFHLHEANRAVGKSVRFLASRADRIYLPEGVSLPGVSIEKVVPVGYPLRSDFKRLPMERARKRLGISMSERLLVVLGGSQGAASLNAWVKQNLEMLAEDGISVYCLTGLGKESSGVVQLESKSGDLVTSRFVTFSDQMEVVLSAANLVVSRAGAGSIAEIIRCRVPSILVPYPYASDDHQMANATYLEARGGGVVCPESQLPARLLEEVREVMFNEEFRAILRRNLFALDHGDVAPLLAQLCLAFLKNSASGGRSRNFMEACA